jgi:hypothetical protein
MLEWGRGSLACGGAETGDRGELKAAKPGRGDSLPSDRAPDEPWPPSTHGEAPGSRRLCMGEAGAPCGEGGAAEKKAMPGVALMAGEPEGAGRRDG